MKVFDANPSPKQLARHCRSYWDGLQRLRQAGVMHPNVVYPYNGYDIFPAAFSGMTGLHPRPPVEIADFSAKIRKIEAEAPEQAPLPLEEIRPESFRHEDFNCYAFPSFPEHNSAARQRQLEAILARVTHPATFIFNGFWRDACRAIFNSYLERFETVSDEEANRWFFLYLAGFSERAVPGDTFILGDDEANVFTVPPFKGCEAVMGLQPHPLTSEEVVSDAQRILPWDKAWGRRWEQQVYLPGSLRIFEFTGKLAIAGN